jgi:hypothetical protein
VLTFCTGSPYIFVKYSLISCFVIRGRTLNIALAGSLAVALVADVIIMGMFGIHIRKPLDTLDSMSEVSALGSVTGEGCAKLVRFTTR